MKIETKFETGDRVYFIDENKIYRIGIHSIRAEISARNKIEVGCYFKIGNTENYRFAIIDESKVFKTIDDLLETVEDDEITDVEFEEKAKDVFAPVNLKL